MTTEKEVLVLSHEIVKDLFQALQPILDSYCEKFSAQEVNACMPGAVGLFAGSMLANLTSNVDKLHDRQKLFASFDSLYRQVAKKHRQTMLAERAEAEKQKPH